MKRKIKQIEKKKFALGEGKPINTDHFIWFCLWKIICSGSELHIPQDSPSSNLILLPGPLCIKTTLDKVFFFCCTVKIHQSILGKCQVRHIEFQLGQTIKHTKYNKIYNFYNLIHRSVSKWGFVSLTSNDISTMNREEMVVLMGYLHTSINWRILSDNFVCITAVGTLWLKILF